MIEYSITESVQYEIVADLYLKTNQNSLSEDVFKWKYLENPAGTAKAIVAQVGNRMVGFMALYPWQFEVDNRSVNAFQLGHLVVDPEWQRKGIFTNIIRVMEAYLDSEEYEFAFGFPNRIAFGGWLKNPKVIWKPELRTFNLVCYGSLWLLGKRLNSDRGSIFEVKIGTENIRAVIVDKLNDSCPLSVEFPNFDNALLTGQHNASFLNWRFKQCPGSNVRFIVFENRTGMLGYAVIKTSGRKLVIYDFRFRHESKALFWWVLRKVTGMMGLVLCSTIFSGPRQIIPSLTVRGKTKQPAFIIPSGKLTGLYKKMQCALTYGDTDFVRI
jgi:GNAT superfamily N-acetyltransferase